MQVCGCVRTAGLDRRRDPEHLSRRLEFSLSSPRIHSSAANILEYLLCASPCVEGPWTQRMDEIQALASVIGRGGHRGVEGLSPLDLISAASTPELCLVPPLRRS